MSENRPRKPLEAGVGQEGRLRSGAGSLATPREASTAGRAEEWRDLGRHALLSGDAAEALWYLRQAVETNPDDPATWQILGRCFEEMGAESRARKCYAIAARELAKRGGGLDQAVGPLVLRWERGRARQA